ncbi:hypothetical protein WL58_17855 [Burkholderia cepacia]|nr:hypothetical protein [Burkholderia cepacia]KWC82736.1 hypothetical protein WL58_17855 [Burkholderia cepacia]
MTSKLPVWISNYLDSSIESSENGMAKVSRQFLVELRKALLAPTQQPSGEVTGGRAYPDEMSPALRDVLGRPNFWCGPIAHEMRAAGAEIKTKAEDEQAHVLHWLVKLVLDHGDDWQKHAATDLRAIREKANAARAEGGES